MPEKLETIFDHAGDDGRRVVLSVDRNNRLYINDDPIVTESRISLNWWVSAAVAITGLSTMALAIVEVGRVLQVWN